MDQALGGQGLGKRSPEGVGRIQQPRGETGQSRGGESPGASEATIHQDLLREQKDRKTGGVGTRESEERRGQTTGGAPAPEV